jgi:hypothetical protein
VAMAIAIMASDIIHNIEVNYEPKGDVLYLSFGKHSKPPVTQPRTQAEAKKPLVLVFLRVL